MLLYLINSLTWTLTLWFALYLVSVLQVLEMSAVGTAVGSLVTEDPDKNQTFTYELTDNADGRFVVEGNVLKVSVIWLSHLFIEIQYSPFQL